MKNTSELFCEFKYFEMIPYEEGITRRDPSPVIFAKGLYYVWYSKTNKSYSGYPADIWYATSKDGYNWQEAGPALLKGELDEFDGYGVFTPSIIVADEKYYLIYTAVSIPFDNNRNKTALGIAISESPNGPWERFKNNPILLPSNNPKSFDSMRVDDACILKKDKKYWLYYKGRQLNKSPNETKMGLAISRFPEGPYNKYNGNPVLDSGHEVCVWPDISGISCLVANTGPQGNTLQHSIDGIHFSKITNLKCPKAPGPFRKDNYNENNGFALSWGISMVQTPRKSPYLVRFEFYSS